MTNWKARIALSVATAISVLASYWLGGGDFTRGSSLQGTFVILIAAMILAVTCPIFDSDERR